MMMADELNLHHPTALQNGFCILCTKKLYWTLILGTRTLTLTKSAEMDAFAAFLLRKWDAAAAAGAESAYCDLLLTVCVCVCLSITVLLACCVGVLRSSASDAQQRVLDGTLQLLIQYNPVHGKVRSLPYTTLVTHTAHEGTAMCMRVHLEKATSGPAASAREDSNRTTGDECSATTAAIHSRGVQLYQDQVCPRYWQRTPYATY